MASAIFCKKDKLGWLVPFSNLAMDGLRVPTISANCDCVNPRRIRSRAT
jgi:hypothetical protein